MGCSVNRWAIYEKTKPPLYDFCYSIHASLLVNLKKIAALRIGDRVKTRSISVRQHRQDIPLRLTIH